MTNTHENIDRFSELKEWALKNGFVWEGETLRAALKGKTSVRMEFRNRTVTTYLETAGTRPDGSGEHVKHLTFDEFGIPRGLGLVTPFISGYWKDGVQPIWFSPEMVSALPSNTPDASAKIGLTLSPVRIQELTTDGRPRNEKFAIKVTDAHGGEYFIPANGVKVLDVFPTDFIRIAESLDEHVSELIEEACEHYDGIMVGGIFYPSSELRRTNSPAP